MAMQHGKTHTWTKSSYSAGNGACVEVMSPVPHSMKVRDSKVPAGSRLNFATGAWSAFLGAAGRGELGGS